MAARESKATPERVAREIARLRGEGQRVGWDGTSVAGSTLIRKRIGGETRRIRAMVILHEVDSGVRVPAVVVTEARQVLRLAEPRRPGPMPKGIDAVMMAAGSGSGTPVLERIALAFERIASAVECLVEPAADLPWPASTSVPAPDVRVPEPSRPAVAAPCPPASPTVVTAMPTPIAITPRPMPVPRRRSE